MPLAKRYKYEEDTSQGKKVASISAVLFYVILFFVLYGLRLDIKKPVPEQKIIELVFEDIQPAPRQGVLRRNPLQKPVPNPPIVNKPGNTAPESAVVARDNQSTKPKPQPESKPSELTETGDVEQETPKPVIDQKSLFQSTATGEEEANNPDAVSEQNLYDGTGRETQATRNENTPIGPDHRQTVTANLSGRSIVGSLPAPLYNSQNQGKVVVEITVDQNGNVTKAIATGKGSTVQDTKLWRAAEEAAKKAKFNVKKDAPISQLGTITYIFKLN
ncbi:MAG: TonB family protein [Prevotellaceae bacterium]|jgi:TonB family protein|nr:TonB family protein [Prevotellaceae bacterium]